MVNPYLLNIVVSHSMSNDYQPSAVEALAHDMWGNDRPMFVMDNTRSRKSKWCHMVLAKGPPLSEEAKYSELIIIWWSAMGPDTERVLSIIDWKKYAKDTL